MRSLHTHFPAFALRLQAAFWAGWWLVWLAIVPPHWVHHIQFPGSAHGHKPSQALAELAHQIAALQHHLEHLPSGTQATQIQAHLKHLQSDAHEACLPSAESETQSSHSHSGHTQATQVLECTVLASWKANPFSTFADSLESLAPFSLGGFSKGISDSLLVVASVLSASASPRAPPLFSC